MQLTEREEAKYEISEKLDMALSDVSEDMIDQYLRGELFQIDEYLMEFEGI